MQEVDDGAMDLEMQLLSPPTADNDGFRTTRNMMHTAILALRSAHMFLAAANHESPPVSRVSSSKSTTSEHYETARSCEEIAVEFDQTVPLLIKTAADSTLNSRKQIRKVINVVRSTLAFKAHANYVHRTCETERNLEVAEACDSSSDQHPLTINHPIIINQLQNSQTKNISNIVRHKDLQTLQDFGGLTGVADALRTDLVTGISENEALCRTQTHAFYPTLDRQTFLHFVWNERKNKTILLLSLAAVLSLVFGIYEEGLPDGLHDGLVVFISIILLVFIASIRKYYQQETTACKKVRKLQSTEAKMAEVHVVRGGIQSYICESKLVCGDVVILNKGCQVPGDGLFVNGESLELDCGSESCLINEQNPFLSYGERVINGDARMLVTSINMEMKKATGDPDTRFKLETHLNKLNTWMHYIGLIISIIITIVLFIRYIVGKMDDENGYKLESIGKPTAMSDLANIYKTIVKESKYSMRGLTKLLSVSLVGVTEGVPFVVSLAIYYWNNKMLFGKAIEQDSRGVVKMASVTRICTDVFGDFTEDEFEVEKLFIGEVISGCSNISPNVVEALCDGIGTLKERQVLHWAKDKLGFKSERMVENMDLHLNGQMEEILSKCTHYYTRKGEKAPIDDIVRGHFDQVNKAMQHKHLRTLAFACKQTHDTQTLDANDIIFVALLGLKSKSKEATKAIIKAYKKCKIETIIVSSKSISVLEDIAFQCEVITNDTESLVITGEVFRKYTNNERLEKADKIRILGEALASDKLLLVETLRKKGEVVAFLGQRTLDAPTLKRADIGIAMGTWSSIKARESSDIIMWDGSFVDLVNMVDSGKCIYHNIQSFVYLVLVTTISSTLLNLVETVALGDASLTIIQLIWLNLAMDFLGGLALLTKPPTDKPVSMDPVTCETSFITVQMLINILFQVSYQGLCLAIVQLKGSRMAGTSEHTKTVVSNMFIFCQFFNQFNARELQNKNFFRGVNRHIEFWVSIGLFIVLHAVFVMVQELTGYGTRVSWKVWAGCVVVGAVSWLVNWFGKCISRSIKIIVGKLCNIWPVTS